MLGAVARNEKRHLLPWGELYNEIKEEKDFGLEKEFIRIALNGDFVELDCPLSDGDEIVFIPPVAGG